MFKRDNQNKVLPNKKCKSRGYAISFEILHCEINKIFFIMKLSSIEDLFAANIDM